MKIVVKIKRLHFAPIYSRRRFGNQGKIRYYSSLCILSYRTMRIITLVVFDTCNDFHIIYIYSIRHLLIADSNECGTACAILQFP